MSRYSRQLKFVLVLVIVFVASWAIFASYTRAATAPIIVTTTIEPVITNVIGPGSITLITPTPTGKWPCNTCYSPSPNPPNGGPIYCPPDQNTVTCASGLQCVAWTGSQTNLPQSEYNWCCSSNGSCKGLGTPPPPGPITQFTPQLTPTLTPVLRLPPQLDLKIRKAGTTQAFVDGTITVNTGDGVDLQWTSANTTTCTASNGWLGTKTLNGIETGTADLSNLQRSKIYTMTCTGPGGTVSDFVGVTVNPIAACTPAECAAPPPFCHYSGGTACTCGTLQCVPPPPQTAPPTLDLKVRKTGVDPYTDGPLTINQGERIDLNWVSANTTSCQSDFNWTASRATNGTEPNVGLSSTTTYGMTCTGSSGGQVYDFVLVNVIFPNTPTPTPAPLQPSVDLKIRQSGSGNSFSDGPITIYQGQAVDLQWNSNNVNNCSVSGDWSGSRGTAGTENGHTLNSDGTFVISCSGPYGNASDVVYAHVISATYTPFPTGIPLPQLDLKVRKLGTGDSFVDGPINVNQGDGAELQWTSYNTNYCNSTNAWSGNKSTNGTEARPGLSTSVTYTLICYGPGGTVSDSVTVLVNGAYPALTVSKSARDLDNVVDNSIHDDYLTARPGDTIEFIITVRSIGSGIAQNVRLTDLLPDGFSYISGSATRDGGQLDNSLALGVINLGDLGSGQTTIIKFRAKIHDASEFNVGTTPRINTAIATTSNNVSTSDNVVIAIQKQPILADVVKQNLISIQKLGHDITKGDTVDHSLVSALPNDLLEFVLILRSPSLYNNVTVRDILPSGLAYVAGSTRLNGQGAADGVTSTSGLAIGSLLANQRIEVRFDVIVADSLSFAKGTTKLLNLGDAMSNSTSIVGSIAKLPINIYNAPVSTGVIAKVVTVPTGTADSLMQALGISFALTLIYMLYTRSFIFKKREITAEIKSEKTDPKKFDFK